MTEFWEVGDPVTADQLNDMSNPDTALVSTGIIARGRRTTATGSVTTTETGVLRIDGIPVYAGRGYSISTSCLNLDTSVNNDIASIIIRMSTAGTATTASTGVTTMRTTIDDATNSNILPVNGYVYPSASGTMSVLLSIVRVAGTGNIVLFSSGAQFTDMVVRDEGVMPADTGVIL